MKRVLCLSLVLGVFGVAGAGQATADDLVPLSGNVSAPTMTLGFDGNVQTQQVWLLRHRWRNYYPYYSYGYGHAPYYGGYHGGYAYTPYYGGYGYDYGYSPYSSGYYGGYSYGYPSYGGYYGSYYPSYYGGYGYGGYGYGGYGYGGYGGYYGGYGWGGYYPCADTTPAPAATRLGTIPAQPIPQGTFPYDGGPRSPVPVPDAGNQPAGKPASPAPRGTLLVRLPRQTTGGFTPAFGSDNARIFPAQAAPRYTYPAYGER